MDKMMVKMLLEAGANVNAVGYGQASTTSTVESTPLCWAGKVVRDGKYGGLELAKTLLEAGADVNQRNGNEGTPLCWAAMAMRDGKPRGKDFALLLVSHGASSGTMRGPRGRCTSWTSWVLMS